MGRTVDELRESMTADEFESWLEFFALYPFDDYHRHHRGAALISASMAGGGDAYTDRLEFLQPDPALADLDEAGRSMMRLGMD